MISLRLEGGGFDMFLNSRHIGFLMIHNGVWIYYPRQRLQDADIKNVVSEEIDQILRVLNNKT